MTRDYKQFPNDDNGDVLWHMRSNGDALTEPREIDFTALFPSKKAASEFAARWRKQYKVELQKSDEAQEDGLDWEVIVYVHATPAHSMVTKLEAEFEKQAAPLGGRMSSWSAVFIPSAPATAPVPDLWWSYLADYDGVPGSITINLGLKAHAPMSDFPTLLMTGVSYESGREKPELKMPDERELDLLNQVSEKRVALVTSRSNAVFVGAFLHDNTQVDYFYVADSDGLEAALREFHEKECPGRRQLFETQSDPNWGAYLDFLYPNEPTREHYRAELEELGAL